MIQPDFHLDLILCYTAKTETLATKLEGEASRPLDAFNNLETPLIRVRVRNGRPDLAEVLDEVVRTTVDGGVGVGACGPGGMVEGVERLVHHLPSAERKRVGGVEVHAERFSL